MLTPNREAIDSRFWGKLMKLRFNTHRSFKALYKKIFLELETIATTIKDSGKVKILFIILLFIFTLALSVLVFLL